MKTSKVSMLLQTLASELQPLGFALKRRHIRFDRTAGDKSDQFQLIILNRKSYYRVSSVPMVRFEQIEQIYHRTSTVDPKFHSESITLGLCLTNEYGVDGYEFALQNEADVVPI